MAVNRVALRWAVSNVFGTVKLSFVCAAGALAVNTAIAEVAVQPVTWNSLSTTFAGIALLWFGGTHIKMRDAVNKIPDRLTKMEQHFERYASLCQKHELEITLLQDHEKDRQTPRKKR